MIVPRETIHKPITADLSATRGESRYIMMNETRKTYGELKIGDVIYWYGALVRIVKINRVNCEKEDCTYFTIEPYNDETVQILGEFYSRGTYGGINKLSVTTIN